MKKFSQKYFGDSLTKKQHKKNNKNFQKRIEDLKNSKYEGVAFAWEINGKTHWFNTNGKEVSTTWIQNQLFGGDLI